MMVALEELEIHKILKFGPLIVNSQGIQSAQVYYPKRTKAQQNFQPALTLHIW